MNIVIYGATKISAVVRDIIEKIYNPEAAMAGAETLNVVCYIDFNDSRLEGYDGLPCINVNFQRKVPSMSNSSIVR